MKVFFCDFPGPWRNLPFEAANENRSSSISCLQWLCLYVWQVVVCDFGVQHQGAEVPESWAGCASVWLHGLLEEDCCQWRETFARPGKIMHLFILLCEINLLHIKSNPVTKVVPTWQISNRTCFQPVLIGFCDKEKYSKFQFVSSSSRVNIFAWELWHMQKFNALISFKIVTSDIVCMLICTACQCVADKTDQFNHKRKLQDKRESVPHLQKQRCTWKRGHIFLL